MASNYKQPPKFDDNTPYETWKNELDIWKLMTDLEKSKQALAITLTLTGRAKETALRIAAADLNKDTGVASLVRELDKVFQKEEKDLAYEAYTIFDGYHKGDNSSISDYIYEYEQRYSKCRKYKLDLPDAVLAFKLLDNADLSIQEKQLAMTACGDLNFVNMKSALKRVFGERTTVNGSHEVGSIQVKQESALYTGNGSKFKRFGSQKPAAQTTPQPVGTNPLNKWGKRTTCVICRSVFHWANNCPNKFGASTKSADSSAGVSKKEGTATETCSITLFTSSVNEILVAESMGAAIIDTACTRTVCGESWLRQYLDGLTTEQKQQVVSEQSDRRFRFGDGEVVTSGRTVRIPAKIGNTVCKIETEVVGAEIPLLLSKPSLKRAGTVLDMEKDTLKMFGQSVELELTSSGHYCVQVLDQDSKNGS
jgi:hypothetical protein